MIKWSKETNSKYFYLELVRGLLSFKFFMKNVLPFYCNFVQAVVRLKICNFAGRCKPFKSTSKNPNEKAKRKNCSPPSSTQARRFIPRPLPRPSTEDGRGRSWSRRSKRPAKRAASRRLSLRLSPTAVAVRPFTVRSVLWRREARTRKLWASLTSGLRKPEERVTTLALPQG